MTAARATALLGLVILATAALSGSGWARDASRSAACPDPKTAPLGKSVGSRGYTVCNDGASAVAVVGGQSYRFANGVCWKDSSIPLNVNIGTLVFDRVKSDPGGFGIVVSPKGSPIDDSIDAGLTRAGKVLSFRGPVTLTYKPGRRSATFKGKVLRTVNGKVLTGTVPVTGSFTCKRILVVPT